MRGWQLAQIGLGIGLRHLMECFRIPMRCSRSCYGLDRPISYETRGSRDCNETLVLPAGFLVAGKILLGKPGLDEDLLR